MNRRGVSFVEILVAILILSATAVSLFRVLRSGVRGTERLSEETRAVNHAASLLESLLAVPFHRLPVMAEPVPDGALAARLAPGASFALHSPCDPAYPRWVTIKAVSMGKTGASPVGAGAVGALKLVRVEVRWRRRYLEGAPEGRSVLSTLVTDAREVWK